MRMTRTLAALVALVASLALTVTLAPANASAPSTQAGFGTFIAKVNSAGTRVIAKGQANNWRRKTVQIQRAPKGTRNWTTVAQPKTDGRGNFSVKLVPGADIPCTGKQFLLRAKKKGRPSAKIYTKKTFYC
ncbi:hypothetical protein HNR19_000259 [Nocardioides thalensis]|uniref:Uncharacterized protein n=1 Tax=Nocardioides thalensis TaxID=1914755 RepID=A0A853BX64_9ACTN|nr:hypothetical protein [Nocardioides thalensis]NYI99560.1 hypothetical protein [Nocardioides thalensis]